MGTNDPNREIVIAHSDDRAGVGKRITDNCGRIITNDLLRTAVNRVTNVAAGRLGRRVDFRLGTAESEMRGGVGNEGVMI